MNRTDQTITTRVWANDSLGPFDCTLDPDPANRANGWLNPRFALDAVRELSAQTLRLANEPGYPSYETIHVIEGRADSQDTVHIIEGGPNQYREKESEETQAVAVHIPWRGLSPGTDASITHVTPQTREAARKRKTTCRGARRVVVVHIRWQYLNEGCDTATAIICLNAEGLYPIAGWGEWTWDLATWWCACGEKSYWHESCPCGLTRDGQPKAPLGIAGVKVGLILRALAPEATSALIDLTDLARICAVYAGNSELDTADDTGPFDTETLGWADQVLRTAMDEAVPEDLAASGWEHVPDERSTALYRITFPTTPTP
ncbi:hypothetical protein [Streptomyces botrytidirepellens]|uniref:Uncharacterized protein n=1 Tax=Streptomyces botrytidirepellens TaxID=2486417 RepID=A0A3M8VCW5_9ACTN|nr:hypothetical protein [Streptomyces botrytidirepellens]RNG14331.1 hypothetical protein EEJ42_31445 [Streptomyces botrytidirepellens]